MNLGSWRRESPLSIPSIIKRKTFSLRLAKPTKSKARYEYQHYNPDAAMSSLARSLISDPSMVGTVDKGNVGRWIKDNCERFDVIIDTSKHDKSTLNFVEGLFRYFFRPKYEGNWRTRK